MMVLAKHLTKWVGAILLLSILLLTQGLAANPSLNKEIASYRRTHALPAFTPEPRLTLAARKVADKLARLGPQAVPENFLETGLSKENYIATDATAFVSFVPKGTHKLLSGFITKPQQKAALLAPNRWEIGTATFANPPHQAYGSTGYILVVILAKPSQPAGNGWQIKILELVNKFRAENRLPPLRLNKKLIKASQAHADDMFVRDFFEHTSPSGTNAGQRATKQGYLWRTILENLATGQPTPFEAVEGWKSSKTGHREAMLNSSITEVGIGYRFMANDKGKYTGQHYWAMTMGLPQ